MMTSEKTAAKACALSARERCDDELMADVSRWRSRRFFA